MNASENHLADAGESTDAPLPWREADILRSAARSFSHGARSSLGTLKSAAQLIGLLLPDREDLAPYLASIVREVDTLASRLDWLEQAARAPSGAAERVVLARAVTQALASIEEQLTSTGMTVAVHGDPSLAVEIDPRRLHTSLQAILLRLAALAAPGSAIALSWSRSDHRVAIVIEWHHSHFSTGSRSASRTMLCGESLPLHLAVAAQALAAAGGSLASQLVGEGRERLTISLQES
jgi:C4-dicarboxylate-specific signal transduction histidine kinase